MDTMSAKNFLQNTEVKFKVKMIATIIPAAIFLITILIEGITGTGIQIMQNIYLISGLILLVATGAVVKLLKIALTAFKWGWLLTPFTLFDLVIAVIAGGFVLGVGLLHLALWHWIPGIFIWNVAMRKRICDFFRFLTGL